MANPVPSTILICSIRLIGDVILTTPLVGLLKDAFPDAAIDILVNRKTGEFLEKDPRIRRVLYSETYDVDRNRRVKGPGYMAQIFRQYDWAINMNASDRGNIAALLAGKHCRVGFFEEGDFLKSFWKKPFFAQALPYSPKLHVARFCQLVAESLGLKVEGLEARIFWDSQDESVVKAALAQRGLAARYFVVHPFARWSYKYWKQERFAQVSDAVFERYGLIPVWTSSPSAEEKALLLDAADQCRHRPLVLAGELSLNQVAFLLSGASLYLGLDTAISHLAASQRVPMVVLYGPTLAERWSPWNNDGPLTQQCPLPRGIQRVGRTVLIQSARACVPCEKFGCDNKNGESLCLAEIETAEVLREIDCVLAEGLK